MNNKHFILTAAAIALLMATGCTDDAPDPVPHVPEPQKQTLELGNVTSDTTLQDIFTDPAVPDYRVSGDVDISASLTLMPGVVIEVAEGKGIDVNAGGFLAAAGQPERKIIFRGKSQTAGFWQGISIYTGSKPSVMEHVEIAHTGSRELFNGTKAAIGLFGSGGSPARLSIKNSLLHHNAGYGIYVASGAAFTAFAANSFTHHAEAGLYMPAGEVQNLDAASVFSDNTNGGIEVFTGTIEGPADVVWQAYHYRFTSGSLSVRTGWKIMPGAVIEMAENQYIEVANMDGAYLNAAGTESKKITFTSIRKEAGAWKGITIFSGHAMNLLEHAVVENGGSAISYGVKANIYIPFSNKLTIRNSKISNSPGYGIYYRSTAILNDDFEQVNTFEANASGGVFKD